MIEKLENPRINDSCSCGWKGCIFCDPVEYKKKQDDWHICKDCGYDDRTDNKKWVISGRCRDCSKKWDNNYDFKKALTDGTVTRDDDIMCPYCGYVLETDIFEYHDDKSFQCPECEKESDMSVEYTAHFTTTKR